MSGGSELKRLPPRLALQPAAAREQKAAQVRGVESIHWMREAIRDAARALPRIAEVPRAGKLDGAAFRARAAEGLPFLLSGVVKRWPLCALTPQDLRERFGDVPVRARVGDYVATAFAPDRAMQDMSLRAYLDLSLDQSLDPGAEPAGGLPPYVGNLELRELNAMCHWPTYFEKMGPPRFWLGPARTVTPLHCDYDDNIFAQVWGTKRIFLATHSCTRAKRIRCCSVRPSIRRRPTTTPSRWRARPPSSRSWSSPATCCTCRPAGITRCAR
jgi:hypothetical protein